MGAPAELAGWTRSPRRNWPTPRVITRLAVMTAGTGRVRGMGLAGRPSMKRKKRIQGASGKKNRRAAHEVEGGASGASRRRRPGSRSGPLGMVVGAVIGGVAGALAGAVLDRESSRQAALHASARCGDRRQRRGARCTESRAPAREDRSLFGGVERCGGVVRKYACGGADAGAGKMRPRPRASQGHASRRFTRPSLIDSSCTRDCVHSSLRHREAAIRQGDEGDVGLAARRHLAQRGSWGRRSWMRFAIVGPGRRSRRSARTSWHRARRPRAWGSRLRARADGRR